MRSTRRAAPANRPAPSRKSFNVPSWPPSPVLLIVLLPPETGVPTQPGTVRMFVRDVHVIGNTAVSDTEITDVTAPFKNRTLLIEDRTITTR